MREAIDIKLGGKDWKIRPLTLGQIRDIDCFLAANPKASASELAIRVIEIALRRDHQNTAGVDEIEATVPELGQAMADILDLGGFIVKAPAPGEAKAADVTSPANGEQQSAA